MSLSRCVRLGGAFLAVLWLAFSTLASIVFSDNSHLSPWLSSSAPSIEKLEPVDLTQPFLPESFIGNRDCQTREVVTRPKRIGSLVQAKISHKGCVVDTGWGAYSTTGYLQRQDSDIYGLVQSGRGSGAMMPIPRSSTGLWLSGGGAYGSYLYFYDNLEESLSSSAIYNGEVSHKLPQQHSAILVNGDGTLLSAAMDSASFSANGEWMVVDIPFVAMVRVDIKTRKILPFGDAINYSVGLSSGYKTAVSPDGKYALVASRNFEILRLYDLSTCSTPPAVIKTKVACDSRDLLPFMRQQIPGFTSLASVRFHSNYTLSLYANTKVNDVAKLTRYVAVAAGQQATGFQYLALGDSFASGEGAYRYKAATDVTYNKCHISQRSYPYLISSALGYGQYESVACSGAIIEDLITDNKKYLGQARDGLKLEERNVIDTVARMLPGYLPQKEFSRELRPSTITISVGGNDVGFKDIIYRCLDTDTCYESYEDRYEIYESVNRQFDNLAKTYSQLKSSTDPRAKLYVIGYPQIANPDGKCDINVRLNRDELIFAGQLIGHLNSVIKKAADNAGAYYVDVEDALNGYKFCEGDGEDVAMNGMTAGNDQINMPFVHGPIANESYHPNALGHKLLKNKILENTNNFTAPMPAPNTSLVVGDIDPNSELLQAPKSNRVIRKLRYYTGTDGGVIRAGTRWGMRATGLDLYFAGRDKVRAWLHSSPVDLGTYTLGSDGSIAIEADIPSSVKPGFHTLHLLGKNSSGEDIDVFKTVYVETGSPCLVPMSGQDRDKDGIDDACDGFIGQPPAVLAATTASTPTKQLAASLIDNLRGDHLLEHIVNLVIPRHENPQVLAAATGQSSTSAEQPSVMGANNIQTPAETEKPKIVAALPQKTSFNPVVIIAIIVLLVFLVSVLVIAL